MLPCLLTLASLAVGDGVPRADAREPVTAAPRPLKEFRGWLCAPGGPLLQAEVRNGDLRVRYPAGETVFHGVTLAADVAGGFRLEWADNVYRGTVSQGPRGAVLTLRPTPVTTGILPHHLPDILRRGGPLKP
jgi:hypothetical protein